MNRRIFSFFIFIWLVLCIVVYSSYGFLNVSPHKQFVYGDVTKTWKSRLYLPAIDSKKASSSEEALTLKSLKELDGSDDGLLFLIPADMKHDLTDRIRKLEPKRNVFIKAVLVFEKEHLQTWEISIRAFHYDRIYFRYSVYKNRVIPISITRVPVLATAILVGWSIFISTIITLLMSYIFHRRMYRIR